MFPLIELGHPSGDFEGHVGSPDRLMGRIWRLGDRIYPQHCIWLPNFVICAVMATFNVSNWGLTSETKLSSSATRGNLSKALMDLGCAMLRCDFSSGLAQFSATDTISASFISICQASCWTPPTKDLKDSLVNWRQLYIFARILCCCCMVIPNLFFIRAFKSSYLSSVWLWNRSRASLLRRWSKQFTLSLSVVFPVSSKHRFKSDRKSVMFPEPSKGSKRIIMVPNCCQRAWKVSCHDGHGCCSSSSVWCSSPMLLLGVLSCASSGSSAYNSSNGIPIWASCPFNCTRGFSGTFAMPMTLCAHRRGPMMLPMLVSRRRRPCAPGHSAAPAGAAWAGCLSWHTCEH